MARKAKYSWFNFSMIMSVLSLTTWGMALVGGVFGIYAFSAAMFKAYPDPITNILVLAIGIASATIPYHLYKTCSELV